MMKPFAAAVAAILILAPATARAQITQVGTSSGSDARSTVNFSIGYFMLKGLESRVEDDVLLNNLQSAQPLLFDVHDFNSATFAGEYLLGIGERFEAGVGLGYSQRTVPSIYEKVTHANGTEIAQDLKLKQVPVTFTGRVLLLPRGAAVEPYVGAGLVAIRYQYSEVGEFIDETFTIFPARFVKDGTASGPTIFGGLRAPVGNWTVGAELRWQKVEADGLFNEGFTGDKLDLGGLHANFTFGVRF
jgi:opacity protein-like surface antigen